MKEGKWDKPTSDAPPAKSGHDQLMAAFAAIHNPA
jgi:hypothetical protein